MIKELFKKFHHAQAGFTLIELITSSVISLILVSGLTASIHHIIYGQEDNQEKMRATQYVQNSGYWMSHDSLMSQSLNIDDDPGTTENEVLILYWVGANRNDGQYDYSDSYEIRYTLDNNKLERDEYVTVEKYDSDGNLLSTDENQKTLLVSENISDISATSANGTIALIITSSVGDYLSQKKYEITPRALDQ